MLRRVARWVLRLGYLAVLGVLFVVSAYSAFNLFVRRGVTPVPSLVGAELETAEQILADRGLRLRHREEDDRYADEVPPGRVLEQRPGPGNLAKRGGLVEVVLSRGKRLVEVPELEGKALPAAQVTLAAVGLQVGRTAHVFSDAGPVGSVVAQTPPGGASVDRGTMVSLFLVTEAEHDVYVMPDLVNREHAEVRHFLERNGFRIGNTKFEPYEGVSRPLVLRQYPLPGHPFHRGEVIALVVAAVPEPSESPLEDIL